jgi:hypothetical protein
MQVANTLAYYDTAIITAVKSFIVQAARVIAATERPVFKQMMVFHSIFSTVSKLALEIGGKSYPVDLQTNFRRFSIKLASLIKISLPFRISADEH